MGKYISVVIPTLNEEENIASLLKGIKGKLTGYDYEIIIVDGHSEDNTVKIAKKYGAKIIYPRQVSPRALAVG